MALEVSLQALLTQTAELTDAVKALNTTVQALLDLMLQSRNAATAAVVAQAAVPPPAQGEQASNGAAKKPRASRKAAESVAPAVEAAAPLPLSYESLREKLSELWHSHGEGAVKALLLAHELDEGKGLKDMPKEMYVDFNGALDKVARYTVAETADFVKRIQDAHAAHGTAG